MPWLIALGIAAVALFAATSKKSDGQIGILPGKQWRFTFTTNLPNVPAEYMATDKLRAAFNSAQDSATITNAYIDSDHNVIIEVTYQKTVIIPPVGTVIQIGGGYSMQLVEMQQLN